MVRAAPPMTSRKLRGKGMVLKIEHAATSHFPKGYEPLLLLVVLRERLIRPLLAASTRPEPDSKLSNPTPAISATKTSAPAVRPLH
jgi:hypothetical protein